MRRLRRNSWIRSVIGSTSQTAFATRTRSKMISDMSVWRWRTMETRYRLALRPNCAAVDWLGMIPPAHLAMKDKPLRYSRRLVESRQRPKKPDPALLQPAPPVENEVRGSPY